MGNDRPRAIRRGEDGFESGVREPQFNALVPPDRPDELVLPRTEDEVAAIVAEAAAAGRKVAVRSGGHSWVSASLREGGVLVDLSALAEVSVDGPALTARVGPGVRGGALGSALAARGLAFPVGRCGTPGIGGYLLGGGLGLNWGAWRPAVYSIRSMRMVTAEGALIRASTDENPEHFWLARGAGIALPAIVTSFELELRPLPADVRLASWTFALDDLTVTGEWLTRASRGLRAEVELSVVLAGPGRPGAAAGDEPFVVGVTAIAYAGDAASAEAALAPLDDAPETRERAEPAPVAFDELHLGADRTYPEGGRVLADTFWTPLELSEALALIAEPFRRAPSGRSYVLGSMPAHGKGASLVTEGEAAYSMHDRTSLIVYAIWDEPDEDAANAAWLDEIATILEAVSSGHFLSEADARRRPERVRRSFSEASWQRIVALRDSLDPQRVFHTFPVGAS